MDGTDKASPDGGQPRIADPGAGSALEPLFDLIERSDPLRVNLVMIGLIVLLSAALMSGFWFVFLWAYPEPLPSGLGVWAVALTSAVALIVSTPAVILGYLLVARVQLVQEQLRQALTETDLANRSKSEFLANMSHEIRTPLNGVLGMTQVLDRTDLSPDQRHALKVIGDSGELLMAIIDDVLDLSKIESGAVTLSPVQAPVAATLQGTVDLFRARADENGTQLRFIVAPSVPETAVFDTVRLRQCLANLVSNAVKFTEGGEITVTVSAEPCGDGWRLAIRVADTGTGIDEDLRKRLFQPFAQGRGAGVATRGGTGLGLAISRRFARLMGGDIEVTSHPGRGSVFCLTAELARPLSEIAPAPTHAAPAPDRTERLRRLHVLIVDDSLTNRLVVRGLLGAHDMRFSEAANGAEALEILSRAPVDLVLLDIQMPVMDGVATLRVLRDLPPPLSRLPVIALTADVLTGRAEYYRDLGFSDYLTKPIRREALLEALARLPR